MLRFPESIIAAAELAEPSGVGAHVTAKVVESVVVVVILGALVVQVDFFTAVKLTLLLVKSIVLREVGSEVIDVLLGIDDFLGSA